MRGGIYPRLSNQETGGACGRRGDPNEPRERWLTWWPELEESSADTGSDEEYFSTLQKRGEIVSCDKHDVLLVNSSIKLGKVVVKVGDEESKMKDKKSFES